MEKLRCLAGCFILIASVILSNFSAFSQSRQDPVKLPTRAITVDKSPSVVSIDTDNWIFSDLGFIDSSQMIDSQFFLDSNTWWIGTKNRLQTTGDGGKSWNSFPLPIPVDAKITQIAFSNRKLGSVLAQIKTSDGVLKSDKNEYWYFTTDDGGRNWNLRTSDKAVNVTTFIFRDATNGWLLGNKFHGISPVRFRPYLLRTDDGGKTWDDLSEKASQLTSNNEYFTGGIFNSDNSIDLVSTENTLLRVSGDGMTFNLIGKLKGLSDRNLFIKFSHTSASAYLTK